MTDRKKGVYAMFLGFREGFTYLARVEIPDPHVGQPRIRCRQHQVGEDYGGICLRRYHSVTRTDPCFLVTAAHDKDDGSVVAGMYGSKACERILALHDPDPCRLAVVGGRGEAAGFQNHFQLGL